MDVLKRMQAYFKTLGYSDIPFENEIDEGVKNKLLTRIKLKKNENDFFLKHYQTRKNSYVLISTDSIYIIDKIKVDKIKVDKIKVDKIKIERIKNIEIKDDIKRNIGKRKLIFITETSKNFSINMRNSNEIIECYSIIQKLAKQQKKTV